MNPPGSPRWEPEAKPPDVRGQQGSPGSQASRSSRPASTIARTPNRVPARSSGAVREDGRENGQGLENRLSRRIQRGRSGRSERSTRLRSAVRARVRPPDRADRVQQEMPPRAAPTRSLASDRRLANRSRADARAQHAQRGRSAPMARPMRVRVEAVLPGSAPDRTLRREGLAPRVEGRGAVSVTALGEGGHALGGSISTMRDVPRRRASRSRFRGRDRARTGPARAAPDRRAAGNQAGHTTTRRSAPCAREREGDEAAP
jgi:hypothetical protein